MIEIRYRYQIEDFEELFGEIEKRFPRPGRLRLMFLLLGSALVLLPFLASGTITHPERDLWWTAPIGVWLICSGWPPSKAKTRKRYARAIFDYDYTATVSDSGIVTSSPTVRTELQWAAFSGYYKTENLFALIYERVMYLFPRRAFSEQQWQEFTQTVQRSVKSEGTTTE
jgi:YcxB-like protein